ncbi:carnitine o-acyltransferase [Holotrichia oblita]|uniref:Carnitine o-acyltransferase n=1 Tax=Holotrichia oblita TaxID=644536 RepID=A0ACB9TVT4_HOLOL|nr:carnitine o-acyltransferase [Holotrichia oblita]
MRKIYIFDPAGEIPHRQEELFKLIKKFISVRDKVNSEEKLNSRTWSLGKIPASIPTQEDCYNCGVYNNVHNGVYPARLWTLWVFMAVVVAIHYSGYKAPYDLVSIIMPLLPGTNLKWQLIGSAITAMLIWFTVIYFVRYTLKLLFIYKGWMYESRGKPISNKTKIWMTLVRILSSWNKPKLYSLQGSIPKLPLPSLKDTLTRYLASVRPLMNDENYEQLKKLAKDFEQGIGAKLQRYLILKSWWSTNYVSDWWEEYVYLRGRSSLMINSNFYGMDAIIKHPTKNQAARAASVISACLRFRRLVDRQELKPLLIQNCIPLCSSQYDRVFNTTRIPGIETDEIVHWKNSSHIAVYHRGRYFKVIIKTERMLNPREIQEQIQQILDDASNPQPGEEKLAAFTSNNRTEWAKIRRCFFSRGTNKTSLDIIEKAAFFVSLDDVPYEYDPKLPHKYDKYAKTLLHGTGYDRWFDKSFTLCIGNNGKMGVNCEHSW